MQRRDLGIARSLGGPLIKRVKESRVLVVGAGGIGCELLKNIVCSGFGSYNPISNGAQESDNNPRRKAEIVVIDLDTIDLSNLNRQFLFRKHHIKKPKALVAKETVSQFNPSVNIDAQHADIFDAKYNVDFFESFDIVFNALDNLAARRHVNRMCLAANVPLIESGTTGFQGQVQAIQKGITECYDCVAKPVQKSFPICTIRSTPSQLIHCIVWAKSYLLPELFGASENESSDVEVTEGDDAEEVAKLKEEAEALKKIREMIGQTEFATAVFNKVFHDDIERLRSMEEMWKSRKAPEALKFEALTSDSPIVKQGKALAADDQREWTLLENISVFCYSIEALASRATAGEAVIEFDKDDKDTLDFVAAAANLRSHIFSIPMQSEWKIKQMAGNIIPAIATSNALTASLSVLEAFKIFRSQIPSANSASNQHSNSRAAAANGKEEVSLGGAKTVFLAPRGTERLINSEGLVKPRPDCAVCSPFYAKLQLPISGATTLQNLVDLLTEKVGYEEGFSISVKDTIIYDPDLEDNLSKPLAEFGIDGRSTDFLTVMDDSDEPKIDLLLSVSKMATSSEDAASTSTELQLYPSEISLPPKPRKTDLPGEEANTNGKTEAEPQLASSTGVKRKRSADDDGEDGAAKKARPSTSGEQNEVLIVDEKGASDEDGLIVLDD